MADADQHAADGAAHEPRDVEDVRSPPGAQRETVQRREHPHEPVHEEVARAQTLLGRDSLEVGLESQANAELARFQLAREIGPNLVVPELASEGFRFRRAQLLRFDTEPVAQLLYLGASGAPLALYAKAGEGSDAPRFRRYGAIGGVAWSQEGVAYLLAGEADEASLLRLADTIVQTQSAGAAEEKTAPTDKPKS